MELIFSEIDEDELLTCANLFTQAFSQSPWNEAWDVEDAFDRLSDFYHCPRTVSLKAVYENQVAGFLIGNEEVWCEDNYFYLKEMCVCHKHQRSGVGSALMKHLEAVLAEKDISRLYLMTQRETIPERFYTSLGYQLNNDLVVMRKELRGDS